MTSRLVVNSVRHTGASADAITLDASGNVTFPANATCSGTATGFGGGKVLQIQQTVKTDTATESLSSGVPSSTIYCPVNITPASASSKKLIVVLQVMLLVIEKEPQLLQRFSQIVNYILSMQHILILLVGRVRSLMDLRYFAKIITLQQ